MSANLLDDGVVGTLVSVWREQCSYIRFHKHAGQANPFAHGRNVADIGHGARDGRQASRLLLRGDLFIAGARPGLISSALRGAAGLGGKGYGRTILGPGAVHDRVAAIEPERVFEAIQALAGALIAAVGKPAAGLQQDRRAEILVLIPPIARARGGGCIPKIRRAWRAQVRQRTVIRGGRHEYVGVLCIARLIAGTRIRAAATWVPGLCDRKSSPRRKNSGLDSSCGLQGALTLRPDWSCLP
jgi:hypothetical protein